MIEPEIVVFGGRTFVGEFYARYSSDNSISLKNLLEIQKEGSDLELIIPEFVLASMNDFYSFSKCNILRLTPTKKLTSVYNETIQTMKMGM